MSPTSGLAIIKENNISLCNIGIQTGGAGDCSFIDNHINTIGFDIYDLDGIIDENYQSFYTANHVFGIGIYIGGSGNIEIRGGKIEWCNIGIWQDYANGMIYDNIIFDRCSLTAIAITAHYKPYTSGIITNNIFYGCGGIVPTVTWQEKHIGNVITGCSIGLSATNNIIVSNNKIIGDNGSLIGSFKTDARYYGPKSAAIICYQTANSSIINNIINCDSQYSCNLLDTPIEFNNNIMNKDVYYNNNRILTYKQNGNGKIYTCFNLDNVGFGNFNTNDIILKSSNPLEGWKVTSAGTKTTINVKVDVVTEGTEFYPGDKTILELKSAYNNMNLNVGCIVSIAGVTGNKIITGIIEHNNKIYFKLNSACDVAVLNATMINVTPIFSPITFIN